MSDQPQHARQRVRDDSDELVAALDNLKDMELKRRGEDISTPPFHELADDIEEQSREVFRVAARETRDGNRAPTSDVSISEVPPSRDVPFGGAVPPGGDGQPRGDVPGDAPGETDSQAASDDGWQSRS